tara:strand:+ start:359 stop:532 length:174 start_codon:yes stop_codon:yes gene_type:complete
MSNKITFSYPTDKTSMDIKNELFLINKEFGIPTSRFVREAVKEKILKTKKIKTASLL